jgi:putative ABC transport system substrate-binding protein
MRRREFITLLGGVAATWPLAARAQQPATPVIGFLHSASSAPFKHLVDAFRKGLSEIGFIEGRNVAIEFRWAQGRYNQLLALATDLVRRNVSVIAVGGGSASTLAAIRATNTIPIVFNGGGDPIKLGFVASLSHPGGNVTGVNMFSSVMETKRLGILHELAPAASLIVVILNPDTPNAPIQIQDVSEGARAIGQQIKFVNATTEKELDTAFVTARQLGAGAALMAADPFFFSQRNHIIALAAQAAIPVIYEQREFVMAGGLMSYGTNLSEGYHQVGRYTGQILKGEKPADLPVMQSTRFEFVINLKTAKMLGIEVPPGLSARADEVIE